MDGKEDAACAEWITEQEITSGQSGARRKDMTIEEIKAWKKEHGYTAAQMSESSGVPLGTLLKILSGETKSPRREAMAALEKLCSDPHAVRYDLPPLPPELIREESFYDGTGAKKIGHHTIDDYLALPDGRRAELIDGIFYDLATPVVSHQVIISQMYLQLARCIEENGMDEHCSVFFAPLGVQLDRDKDTMVEPDLFIYCDPEYGDGEYPAGAPDFVMEVLSPSTRSRDLYLKLHKYHDAGVREYWIVDPKKEKVTVHHFEDADEAETYSFDDEIPVIISEGKCTIDFHSIHEYLEKMKKRFGG